MRSSVELVGPRDSSTGLAHVIGCVLRVSSRTRSLDRSTMQADVCRPLPVQPWSGATPVGIRIGGT